MVKIVRGKVIRAFFLAVTFMVAQPALAQLRTEDGLAALDAGDAALARQIWAALAAAGDVLAQHNLAVLKLTGQGGAQDMAVAQRWFKAAAGQGYLPAKLALLDQALAQGDRDQAQRWALAAAEAGDAGAQFTLARLLEDVTDTEGAVHWYRAAAQQGLVIAQSALAEALTEHGAYAEAADWFEAAAIAGDLSARHNLAVALAQGLGRVADPAAARALYLQAAQAGYAPSMRNLAVMQARGQGGVQSFRFALAWALAAKALAEPDAAEVVSALREVMSDQAIAQAEALQEICRQGLQECN